MSLPLENEAQPAHSARPQTSRCQKNASRVSNSTLTPVATFLLKTEPTEYSYDDLVRDKKTAWTGVRNPAAQAALRSAAKGDEAFIYHTGDEKRVVGLARVLKAPHPDHTAEKDTMVAVEIGPLARATTPITLAAIKADRRFKDWALVKQPRLSVMTVPPELDRALRQLAGL